jgi:predicted ArsR family transcriptional regulator
VQFSLADADICELDNMVVMELMTEARERVARTILTKGPISASDLAKIFGVSDVAMRRMLDALAAADLIQGFEQAPYGPAKPKGRGRPARVFSITENGRNYFESSYDQIANDAVEYINQIAGKSAIKEFANKRSEKIAQKFSKLINKSDPLEKKVQSLKDQLILDGYLASVQDEMGPTQTLLLCQHHCPIAHVASEHSEFCDAETKMFSDLLGVNVTRLSTMATGGEVCTSLISKESTKKQKVTR